MRKRHLVISAYDRVHEVFHFTQSIITYVKERKSTFHQTSLFLSVHMNISFSWFKARIFTIQRAPFFFLLSVFLFNLTASFSVTVTDNLDWGSDRLACCALKHKSRVKHHPVDKQKAEIRKYRRTRFFGRNCREYLLKDVWNVSLSERWKHVGLLTA